MLQSWNCPISEVVNEIDGVYCMIPKQDGPVMVLPKEDYEKTLCHLRQRC